MHKSFKHKYIKYDKKISLHGGRDNIKNIVMKDRFSNTSIDIESSSDVSNIICCIENIGKGSFGSVSKGIDENTGETIIIKKIKISKNDLRKTSIPSQDDYEKINDVLNNHRKNKLIEKLEKELQIMKLLNHRNIIKYIGHEEVNENSDSDENEEESKSINNKNLIKDKILSIYMEDICGKNISKISQNIGGLSLNLISKYSKQILDALNYMHSLNIIHMDIKGDNILLSNKGEIKLIDFGESVQINKDDKFILPYAGSVLFIAPELTNQTTSKIYIEFEHLGKNDIWSLGVVLIEMFVGNLYYPKNFPKNHIDIMSIQNSSDYLLKIFLKNLLAKINNKDFDNFDNIDIQELIIELIMDETQTKILSFIDFVGCCLEKDYKMRFSAKDLLTHPFLNQYEEQTKYHSSLLNI
jgi:serine/threonine protein kinase